MKINFRMFELQKGPKCIGTHEYHSFITFVNIKRENEQLNK